LRQQHHALGHKPVAILRAAGDAVVIAGEDYGITGRPEYRYRLVAESVMLLTQYSQ
jgi:hypothetical protein